MSQAWGGFARALRIYAGAMPQGERGRKGGFKTNDALRSMLLWPKANEAVSFVRAM